MKRRKCTNIHIERYSKEMRMRIEEFKKLFEPVLLKTSARSAYLFGSRARGTEDPESDVDLVIVADTERPFVERCLDFMELVRVSPAPVEMLVYTPFEFRTMSERGNGFIMNVLKEGILLYERSAA